MGINVKWDITNVCNLNCNHCINGDSLGRVENELSHEEMQLVIKKLDNSIIETVHMLGGEPTARKDFINILKAFETQKIKFGFNTNGLKMNDKAILDELIHNKYLTNIVFSLEGPNAEINDMIRGKNVFETTIRNLKNIIKLKEEYQLEHLCITINTVLSKLNMNHIEAMMDMCIELKVDQFVLLQFIAGGNAKNNDHSINFDDELKMVELIAKKYDQVKNSLEISPRFTRPLAMKYAKEILGLDFPDVVHGCGAGTNFAYMNNKGELYPCDRYSDKIRSTNPIEKLSLVKNDFYEIWGLRGYNDLYAMTEGKGYYVDVKPCNDCEYLQSTCYPCPESINKIEKNFEMDSCSQYFRVLREK